MRDWTLGPGDPQSFTLASDFRLGTCDYVNDHIWELEPGGDPPALALRTTYGLRARTMRIFPSFNLGKVSQERRGDALTNPSSFALPPRLRHFFPNYLQLDFSPFAGIDILAEYWVPDSHVVAGRFTVTNRGGEPLSLEMNLCGQLVPLEGQSFTQLSMQSVNVLAGRTSDLAPVIFLTGGPQAGPGPYPCLTLDLALAAGGSRTFTWVQAALANPSDSFELARRTAARPWEAERARIEMVNAAQTVEVRTGDPDWDAALALSQKTAFSLFFGPSPHFQHPSFVLTRQPDQGYSLAGDGSDYSRLWNGQSPLESIFLASLLPGAPELAAGLVRNSLSTQAEDGSVDWKPGLAGQRGRWLAAPLLASLAWQVYQNTHDVDFLREVQPGLKTFLQRWFDVRRDRDGDGFPEWDHSLQSGFEDNPAFTVWQKGGQGANITTAENPALAAMLCRETCSLAKIAETLGQPQERENLELKAGELRSLAEECWNPEAVLYHNRDRDSHRSPAGRLLGDLRGGGTLLVNQSFRQAVRLLVRLGLQDEATRRPEVILNGRNGDTPVTESLERMSFQWGAGLAVATSSQLYSRLEDVVISGVEKTDHVSVQVMDFSAEDVTLFLPMWAGIPNVRRARTLVSRTLFAAERFWRPFGIPSCVASTIFPQTVAVSTTPEGMDMVCQAVHLPWNTLIGEALLEYGFREEAAQLTAQLISVVIQNLKKQHAFARAYHAESGMGIGERNALQGLAPLGLFLNVLGVRIESASRVTLSGKNPFPWPVTVKYRGLTVTRQAEQTVIIFPNGQTVTVNDPVEAIVSIE